MSETYGSSYSESSAEGYAAVHDWDCDEQVVVTVVEALAEHAGVPAHEIPPLYDSVDPEALDAVVRTLDPEVVGGRVRVTLSILDSEYVVTVHADGGVEIDEND